MSNLNLSIFTSVIFVIVAMLFSVGLYNMNRNKLQVSEPYSSYHHKKHKKHTKTIDDADRNKFIIKCNRINRYLDDLLTTKFMLMDNEHKKMLEEQKHFIKNIKDIVNDLSFNNQKEFEHLYSSLKQIQNDIYEKNKDFSHLQTKMTEKEELVNMLIQRMISDSSQRSLKESPLLGLLDGKDKEDELLLLEKYIIKTIRQELGNEMNKYMTKTRKVKKESSNENEIERKLELMDLVNNKLSSMENLYRNLHSTNKKQIIQMVKTPVKKTIKPYMKVESLDKELEKSGLKVHRMKDRANTYYVVD